MSTREDEIIQTSKSRKPRGKYTTRACDNCKTRKARCNGMHPCSNCVASKKPCTYLETPKRKRYVETLELRLETMEQLLRRISPQLDLDTVLSDKSPVPLGLRGHLFTSNIDLHGLAKSALDVCVEPAILSQESQVDEIAFSSHYPPPPFRFPLHPPSKEVRHLDGSKQMIFSPINFTARKDRHQTTIYQFPEDNLLLDLVNLYFERFNYFTPLLHRPTFTKLVSDRMHEHDSKFGVLLLGVCALGAKFSNDPRVLAEGENCLLSNGWKYFNQVAKDLYPGAWLEDPCLYDLQTACVSAMFLHTGSSPISSWSILGTAIRVAQAMNAHRRRPSNAPLTVEAELLKRVWWSLVCIDRMLCCAIGRPCAIQYEDFDADLPAECDDEYWEHPDPQQAFQQPAGKPSKVSLFVSWCKLTNIAAMTLRALYSPKPYWKVSTPGWEGIIVRELDSALNRWLDGLPDHIRWDPHRELDEFFDQSVAIFCLYCSMRMLIHRPFLGFKRKHLGLSQSSMAVCTNAARACSNVLDTHYRRRGHPLGASQVHAFTSAVVLLLGVWSKKQPRSSPAASSALQDVQKCVNYLRLCEERWAFAGKLSDVLSLLLWYGDQLDAGNAGDPSEENLEEGLVNFLMARADSSDLQTANLPQLDVDLDLLFPLDPTVTSDDFYSQLQATLDASNWWRSL